MFDIQVRCFAEGTFWIIDAELQGLPRQILGGTLRFARRFALGLGEDRRTGTDTGQQARGEDGVTPQTGPGHGSN